MRILKKIIRKIYHLIWFLSVFFIVLLPVNADVTIDGALFTQSSEVTFADNTNNYLTSLGATFINNGSYWRSNDSIITTGGDSYGANFAFYSAIPFVQGHTYAVSVLIGMANTSAKASSSRLCIAENITNAIARNNLGFPCTTAIVTSSNTSTGFTADNITYNYTILSYIFTAEFTANALTAPYNSNGRNESNHTFGGYIVRELSSQPLTQSQITSAVQSSGLATANSVSQVQSSINQIQTDISQSSQNIINNNNSNTQSIIDSSGSNTQSIIENSGSNTQSIIDNNNQNTQQEIESQKVCSNSTKPFSSFSFGYLDGSGNIVSSYVLSVSNFFDIKPNNNYTLYQPNNINGSSYCLYKQDKSLSRCLAWNTTRERSFTSQSDEYFVRTTFYNTSTATITGKICQSGNQVLNDTLTDDTTPDIDLDLTTASDTPISDLITMPLTILNGLYQTLTDSCTNYTLPFFYSTTILFPCFTISDYLGTNITNYIDLFICLYMCYNIAMLVISVFEDITSLRDIYDSLYEPKHAYTGYHPRHAKGE